MVISQSSAFNGFKIMDDNHYDDGTNRYYFSNQKKRNGKACINPTVEETINGVELMPVKTPVSILQELLSRRGSTPKYELVQIEGAIHEPTFRYRVTAGDTVALGTGRSKKVAKHAAAKNLLENLIGRVVYDDNEEPRGSVEMECDNNAYETLSGNPIGALQELCISHKWPPPTYEMTCEEGLPHERQFTITCIVFKYRETGFGKSKKLAKRQAAYKMWERLQENPPDLSAVYDEIQGSFLTSSRYADVKSSKISTLTTPHSHKVSSFHKTMKQSCGLKLDELQTVLMHVKDFDFVEFLQEIAEEQHFEVTYVDIEERSFTGKCQCLVQLSTLPVAVCFGAGQSPAAARKEAAHNALEYLKIMTKK